ncbi:MAG TPA: hypothetical protein H9821_00845 [Candidatus Rothia avicola]|uniref:Uncharacterized protein n=1 Tax=Candidatus Rothia avicola TaxID=2840478 RepID=A0A9D2CPL9_9MICC|nr:hypothetical protein [Candidatus Rothia avicola]
MSQKNKDISPIQAENKKKKSKFSWFRFIIVVLIFMSPFIYVMYSLWQLNITDRYHQVSLVCTVESAEYKSSTSSGARYSSSRDDIVFSTVECEGLYLTVSEGEIESTLSRVEPGKKYEFMLGETGVDSWGQRRVYSFSGPVE